MPDTVEIANYEYYVWSSRNAGPGLAGTTANVLLYASDRYLGAIFFLDTTDALPLANQTSSGIYSLYYRIRELPAIIDMLRNEKPVYLHFNDGMNGRLSTTQEPVGEGEV